MVGLNDFYSMIGSISEILLHDWWHLRAFLALISLTGPSRWRLGSLQASVLMAVLRKEGTSNLWSTISFRVLSLVICMGPILQMRTLDPEKESDLLQPHSWRAESTTLSAILSPNPPVGFCSGFCSPGGFLLMQEFLYGLQPVGNYINCR